MIARPKQILPSLPTPKKSAFWTQRICIKNDTLTNSLKVTKTIKGTKMINGKNNPHHFVLVHGACHGAWCWYKVVTQLRSEGHRVTALDMAAAGADPKPVEEIKTLSDYCQPLIEFMSNLPTDERIVLVGHSMGGVNISVAMENFPIKIAVAVFVAAFMPGPELSLRSAMREYRNQRDDTLDCKLNFSNGHDKPPTSLLFGPKFLSSYLYQRSPPEDLTLATLLVRPTSLYGEGELLKKEALTKQNYGSVRRVYVICENDDLVKQNCQEWMIENNPTDEVKRISGADHMPMFSKPQELCVCLTDLAHKYC